jgi:hypothetical protein
MTQKKLGQRPAAQSCAQSNKTLGTVWGTNSFVTKNLFRRDDMTDMINLAIIRWADLFRSTDFNGWLIKFGLIVPFVTSRRRCIICF